MVGVIYPPAFSFPLFFVFVFMSLDSTLSSQEPILHSSLFTSFLVYCWILRSLLWFHYIILHYYIAIYQIISYYYITIVYSVLSLLFFFYFHFPFLLSIFKLQIILCHIFCLSYIIMVLLHYITLLYCIISIYFILFYLYCLFSIVFIILFLFYFPSSIIFVFNLQMINYLVLHFLFIIDHYGSITLYYITILHYIRLFHIIISLLSIQYFRYYSICIFIFHFLLFCFQISNYRLSCVIFAVYHYYYGSITLYYYIALYQIT